jgi:trehalose 6-phosphate phosphatase
MTKRPGPIDADHNALFLDVDGTLLAIQSHPDAVVADPALLELIAGLQQHFAGAVALVSGRTIAALDRIFAPLQLSAAGAHGTEARVGGGAVERDPAHGLPDAVIARLQDFAGAHDGLVLEDKPGGASLHYRQAPTLEQRCRRFVRELMDDLHADFRVIDGDKVLELAPVGASKGEAIRGLLGRDPFAGRRPVFVGDDTTDEDGFRAVNALGGISVRVGAREGSAAEHVLEDIDAVRRWLAASIDKRITTDAGDCSIAQP